MGCHSWVVGPGLCVVFEYKLKTTCRFIIVKLFQMMKESMLIYPNFAIIMTTKIIDCS